MTYGNSDNQSALPFSNTGFFKKFLIVLINRSAILGPLSVYLEKYCIFFTFRKFGKTQICHSDPLSISNLRGLRFDVVKIFEKSFVIARPYLFFKGEAHKYLEKLSNMINIYLYPLFFEVL